MQGDQDKFEWLTGIPSKTQENDLQGFQQLKNIGPIGPGVNIDQIFDIQMKKKIQQMRNHPQQYFNFGFNYQDFQAYLMKLMYCRALRKFIQRKRMQRIQQYFKTGPGMPGSFGNHINN